MLIGATITATITMFLLYPPVASLTLAAFIGSSLAALALATIDVGLFNKATKVQAKRLEKTSPTYTRRRVNSPDVIMREMPAKLWRRLDEESVDEALSKLQAVN
jgi:hypothetical protein